MKEKKRWGKNFIDKRDWITYNEELVVRGEFLLDIEWVKAWNSELEEMNKHKVGAKYKFPESLIKLQSVWHQWIDYRGIEGITRQLVEVAKLPDFNDYSTINRRVNRTQIKFKLPQSGSCCVSTDGSGMKFENSGEYRARMYGKRRKYIKVVISADPIKKKMINCEVGLEGELPSEPQIAISHMEALMINDFDIEKFWGDGAFDTHDIFAFLEHNDIKSAVKIRKNAKPEQGDCLRNREIIAIKKGYKKWARERQYGLRWNGTEGIFSAVKRKFGEQTRSTKIENAFNEVKRKFWIYDEMKEYAKNRI